MESNLTNSPMPGHPSENSDVKYISGLSTILVATIQEAKDRISQIEYIFCSQLYPNFQLNPQSLQKIYSEAQKAAEDAYKEKEKNLLLQIEKLRCQNQQTLEENQFLKLEKKKITDMERKSCNHVEELQNELKQKTVEANEGREVCQNLQKLIDSKSSLLRSYEASIGELEERNTMLLKMQKKLEVGTEELKQELMQKSKEVDEVMELQNKLLQMNQTKSSTIIQKDTQLKEYEVKANIVVSKLADMENKANELQSEVDKGKDLHGNLLKKIEAQSFEIMNHEHQLNKYEKENRHLAAEVEKKSVEIEEVKKQQKLLQHGDSFSVERAKRERSLDEFMEERKRLLDKQKVLENTVTKLEKNLSERIKESSEGMELHGKLLQQIEVKDSKLLAEKKNTEEAINAYKKVKSQYNFLLKKCGFTPDNGLVLDEMEDKSEIIRCNQTLVTSRAAVTENNKASGVSGDVTKLLDVQKVSEDKKRALFVQRTNPISPSTSVINKDPKFPTTIKPFLPAGAKRPISYWRDTRSNQSRVGPDHDDFLDTPLENVRGNIGKPMKGDNSKCPKPAPMDMNLADSDDQTQDMNAANAIADGDGPQNLHTSPSNAGTSGFKYVGPVRKKSERENLKGIECKQCKKFYDAVLPGSGDKQNVRCEHHDGVSRHRYRYAPPSTPEGFWNIGFESEM